jgi:hypothetical protein
MSRRRGELTKAAIDRGWPHQVALPADQCMGADHTLHHEFCAGLSLCPRGHCFRRDDTDFHVYCFAKREHAERFKDRFSGELISPKDRSRWPGRK